jgi:hypothetical protein
MGMSANLHRAVKAKAEQGESCSWLSIANDNGDHVTVFMPFDQAKRMALAFHENPPAQIDPDEPEAADYDDGNITS